MEVPEVAEVAEVPVKRPAEEAPADAPPSKEPRGDNGQPPAAEAPAAAGEPARLEGKKRKVLLFLGYVGEGYQGMQRNPGAVTIEDALEEAFYAAGALSAANKGDLRKVQYSRAARTDKGVSAVGQCVALKLHDTVGESSVVARVNEKLPTAIRVFGAVRVTGGFNAKNLCDRRRYKYVLPEWAFCREHLVPEARAAFRLPDAQLDRLNSLLSLFCGTHNFHNFTVRVKPTDPQARRYILAFDAGPAVEAHGTRLVVLTVLGQSFMLHQIRKMVGAVLGVMRGVLPATYIAEALASKQHRVRPGRDAR